FCHPPHGPEFIPTLQSSLLEATKKYFGQFEEVSVDDVDKDGWPILVNCLVENGSNIKVLNMESCSEKDNYGSKRGLSTVFPFLSNLECLRLDGLSIGSSDFHLGGDLDLCVLASTCPNLRVVALDFCDVTLQSFYTLWKECPNLEFIGLAGLQDVNQVMELDQRPHLKTLRFVDCQINDQLIEQAMKQAPNLNMLRVVYEYPGSFANNWNPHDALSDALLHAVANYGANLQVLAISKTARMTPAGFNAVLKACPIRVMDFHSTESSAMNIGNLDDQFIIEILPFLKTVKSLNLFDQANVTERTLMRLVVACPSLESLCINGAEISTSLFTQIIESKIHL
ncbi:hypothetical protein HDU91_003908, partial [Kappamyces sp. JEL0680]